MALTTTYGTAHTDQDVIIQDDADSTKELKWELSSIATGTTRTITMPDADVTLAAGTGLANIVEDVTPQWGADMDANAFGITFSELFDIILDTDISSGNAMLFSGAAAGELNASSGTQSFLAITPHINQSSTGAYNGIFLDVTETGTGSGAKNLMDLQVGSVSKFAVGNGGIVTTTGDNGSAVVLQTASTELTGMTGATVTATNLIPAASFIVGVTVRVTTTITGATTFTIGDGSDPDRWGAVIALSSGTTTTIADFTAAGFGQFATANDVVLTATGANFTAGAVRIIVNFFSLTAATS